MDNEELLYIDNNQGRKLFYRFTPASFISVFTPLVVILHDKDGSGAAHFEYKMWNVLTPIHDCSSKNTTSCWLGEGEDFFVKDLLQELIENICQEHDCEDQIYFYGKGEGGYGAILHGILSQANAVFTQSPQIRLEAKKDETKVVRENDLSRFLNETDTFPIFYLCEDKFLVDNNSDYSAKDEIDYFTLSCKKQKIRCHRDFCPKPSDKDESVLKEVLDMFERE